MAQNDLAGLLTGVSQQRRNPLNPMSSNLTPDQQYMAMGAQNVGVMQSGMRGLMGTPSVDEQRAELNKVLSSVLSGEEFFNGFQQDESHIHRGVFGHNKDGSQM